MHLGVSVSYVYKYAPVCSIAVGVHMHVLWSESERGDFSEAGPTPGQLMCSLLHLILLGLMGAEG